MPNKQSKNVVTSGWPNRHLTGCAAEKLAAYDLYMKGALELTWPDNSHGPDDLHARFASGWYSVQVKTGRENLNTGSVIVPSGREVMTSHIVAIVGMRTTQVRYIANGKELPEELRASI